MKLILLDTSTRQYSIALSDDDRIIGQRQFRLDKMMESTLITQLNELLSEASLSLKDIHGFGMGLGPGGFTSLRVGISTVKGLAFALNKPIVGVSSLDVIAMNAPTVEHPICVISDAKKKMFYVGLYRYNQDHLTTLMPNTLMSVNDILSQVQDKTVFLGDGISLIKEHDDFKIKGESMMFTEQDVWWPQAKNLLPLVKERFENEDHDESASLIPIYLHADDCQVRPSKG